MTVLTLDLARRIVDAAFEAAERRGVTTVIALVTDAGGGLKALQRSDRAGAASVDIAHAKARTALGFGRSTLSLVGFRENEVVATVLSEILSGRFMPMGGGVVVADAQGEIIGAAAVSGAAADIDHAIIAEAVQSVGLKVLD
jgi:uncharacterized protein GlcG (DUF336 family)